MKQQQRTMWESYARIRFPTFIGAVSILDQINKVAEILDCLVDLIEEV
ncbi:hypothetical protein [Ktedonobacter racemifer]|uniref:Uncharacterized protein n=1 Tax=Ktedonobacter racemifer DSM 44963 TaxID=485913 RepID=D6TS60_KTERA|nr:hypothetical protein [Ktedonobacter racemifer]EFH86133.1 hypothetical protein Krac_7410 [Ktedonobacter racemifer DSM 44963]